MSRALSLYFGAYLGTFACYAAAALRLDPPAVAVPGILLFAAVSAAIPSAAALGGFAVGHGILRREASSMKLLVVAFIFAVTACVMRYAIDASVESSRAAGLTYLTTLLVGGFALAAVSDRARHRTEAKELTQ